MVSVVLDNLAAGESVEDIVRGYHLKREDVQAAMQYGAELARETVMPITPGAGLRHAQIALIYDDHHR